MKLVVYGNNTEIPGPFEHRGVTFRVFRFDKGAKHCEKQHDFRTRHCGVCGEPLTTTVVYLGFVNNKQFTLDCASSEEVVRMVQIRIDASHEDEDNEGGSGERDTSGKIDGELKLLDACGWLRRTEEIVRAEKKKKTPRALPSPK